jgi:ASC-1-like (ASCH) protein
MAVVARTLYRSRLYIELLRSGQRSIDACPASAPFRPLQRGDRVNISAIKSANVDLVCEIVDKRHYKDLTELIAAEGVERCLGVRTNATGKDGAREGNAVRVLSPHGLPVEPHEFEQFGVFAFHLRVVEDV